MVNNPDMVTRYRNRAKALRAMATTFKNQKRREDFESWAKEYDQMAFLAETLKQPQ